MISTIRSAKFKFIVYIRINSSDVWATIIRIVSRIAPGHENLFSPTDFSMSYFRLRSFDAMSWRLLGFEIEIIGPDIYKWGKNITRNAKIASSQTTKLTFLHFGVDMVINNFDFRPCHHHLHFSYNKTCTHKNQIFAMPLFMHVSEDVLFFILIFFYELMIDFCLFEINKALLRKYLYKTV